MSSGSSPPGKPRGRKPASTSTRRARAKDPDEIRPEYDFSNARPNPYAALFRKQSITIRVDEEVLAYFKALAEEIGMPYQSLINFYLRDCARSRRRPAWTDD